MSVRCSPVFPRQKVLWLAASLFAVVLLCVTELRGSSPATDETVGVQAKQGEAIFQHRCIICHNKQPGDTSPFGPPNLHGIFRGQSPLSTKDAEIIITNGKGQMPAWGKVLTKSDISDVIAYLKTR